MTTIEIGFIIWVICFIIFCWKWMGKNMTIKETKVARMHYCPVCENFWATSLLSLFNHRDTISRCWPCVLLNDYGIYPQKVEIWKKIKKAQWF